MKSISEHIKTFIWKEKDIAPLAFFRIVFGGMMFISIIRFWAKGWITELYVEPEFFFPYQGFEWIQALGDFWMHLVFLGLLVTSFLIMIGCFYRISISSFFLLFTYVELLDKTNYLNHYYFISIVALLLIFLPAHRAFSIDIKLFKGIALDKVPSWVINSLKLQIGIVYFFAGLAKINPSWLLEAMPLKLWLASLTHLPLIGWALQYELTAYLFSWGGMFFDLCVFFFLLNSRTRVYAYSAVVAFHLLTGSLFPIGMFPLFMIGSTLIFFEGGFHRRVLEKLQRGSEFTVRPSPLFKGKWVYSLFIVHFSIQLLLPLRSHLYDGNLFWTEEGYRFSWRVMLMEKAGYTTFSIEDKGKKGSLEVVNSDFLTPNQEKMMATQPDMIVQFAHYLGGYYKSNGIENPVVYSNSFVTLNGSGSQRFIDSEVDLTKVTLNSDRKDWVLPFNENKKKGYASK